MSDTRPLTPTHVAAASEHAFGDLVSPHRRELLVHCYRLLGATLDAEDAVQETLLRAYRRRATFRREGSFRAWLYKIATNVCLDALGKRRRTLPTAVYAPADPAAPLPEPVTDPVWLEPLPGGPPPTSPAARVEARESVALAFVAALQWLTPRQRAVLILRDVLDFRAREAAAILDMSLGAANSALLRARRALATRYPPGGGAPADSIDEALLQRYIAAWEAADIDALVTLLQEEASLAMPPWPLWYRGREAIRAGLRRDIFGGWWPGQDRLRPIQANGQSALALYRQTERQGAHHALAIHLLTPAATRTAVGHIIVFLNPALFVPFSLPATLDEEG